MEIAYLLVTSCIFFQYVAHDENQGYDEVRKCVENDWTFGVTKSKSKFKLLLRSYDAGIVGSFYDYFDK